MTSLIKTVLRRFGLPLLATAFLASCGSDTAELEVSKLIQSGVTNRTNKADVAASQAAVLKVRRAEVDAVTVPLLRVRIEGTGALATLAEVDRKGAFTTFQAGDGISLMFKRGILIGTRGFGQDLMSLNAPSLSAARAKGSSTRRYRYLDGNDRLIALDVRCHLTSRYFGPLTVLEISYDVTEVSETCRGADPEHGSLEFENYYWMQTGSGRIVQSRQFISPKFGRAEIEVLTR